MKEKVLLTITGSFTSSEQMLAYMKLIMSRIEHSEDCKAKSYEVKESDIVIAVVKHIEI